MPCLPPSQLPAWQGSLLSEHVSGCCVRRRILPHPGQLEDALQHPAAADHLHRPARRPPPTSAGWRHRLLYRRARRAGLARPARAAAGAEVFAQRTAPAGQPRAARCAALAGHGRPAVRGAPQPGLRMYTAAARAEPLACFAAGGPKERAGHAAEQRGEAAAIGWLAVQESSSFHMSLDLFETLEHTVPAII